MANQVDFKILPSDQFSVHSPATRSEKIITYFTLLSKLRGDILAVSSQDDPNNIVSAYYTNVGNTQTLHLVKADGSEVTASNDYAGTVTSVGVSMPSAFTVTNSPITTSGTIQITGAGNDTQYVRGDGTLATFPSLTGFVPYVGATQNVDLGEYEIKAGQVAFDLTPTGTAGVGVMRWNAQDGTVDLGLMGGNVTLQVGQEQVTRVVNKAGVDLTEAAYQAVKITGAQGNRLKVGLAQANNDANSTDTLGLVTENINQNNEGFVTSSGLVRDINTTGSLQGETWADGDVLYLSPTTAGRVTNIKPTAPQHTVTMGFVVRAHATQGQIYVKVDNGYELEELHDVAPTPYVNNGVLYRDTTTNLWKSATIPTLLGYTPANAATTISTTAPLSGGGDLSANRTLSISQAGASTDGYLSSTDWNTFNNKQGALTFTAPLVNTSGTITITQAGASTNGYLSSTDWNTFNNKASDAFKTIAVAGQSNIVADSAADTLTFEAGSNIVITTDAATDKITITALGGGSGSVTSVDMSVPTGFSISGNPITTTGTLALAFASGYSLPTNASQATWDTAYNNSITAFAYNTSTGVLTLTQQDAGTLTATVTLQPFTTDNLTQGSTNLYDKVVSLTGAGTTVVTGTYPNFTITSNDQHVGTVTSIATSAPITGGTITTSGTIGITQSGTAADGYLSSTDWNTFNSKVGGSGTINYVSKWTSTGAIGNSQIFDSGTYVGINTATPAAKLDISGAHVASIGLLRLNASAANIAAQTYYIDGVYKAATYAGTDDNFYVWGRDADIVFNTTTSGTTRMVITNGGNVGIGTTGPTQKLMVGGSIRVTGGYYDSSNSIGSNGQVLASTGTGTAWINVGGGTVNGSGTVNYLSKWTGTTLLGDSVIYDNGTNVGIGTTAPGAKLDVLSADPIRVRSSGTTGYGAGIDLYHSSSYRAYVGFPDSSAAIGSNQLLLYTGSAYPISFYTNNAERIRITSSGNVGIGTTAPGVSLEVAGTIRATTSSGLIDVDPTSGAFRFYDGTTFRGGLGTGGWASVGATADIVQYLNGVNYYISNTSTALVKVEPTGKVGIGTTSPSTKLSVSGSDDAASTGVIEVITAGGTNLKIGGNTTYSWIQSHNSSPLYINQLGNNLILNLGGGNVGIGTSSPSQKLHVSGSLRVSGAYYDSANSAGTSGQVLSSTGTGTAWINAASGSVTGSGTTNYVTKWTSGSAVGNSSIYDNGNVGIGTTAPQAKLHVSGTVSYGSARFSPTSANGESAIAFYDDVAGTATSTSWVVGQAGWGHTGDFIIGNENGGAGGNVRLLIERSGNVGIGTTAPGALLDVGGGDGTPNGTQFTSVVKGTSSRTMYFDGGGSSGASVWWGDGNTPQFAIDSISGGGASMWVHASSAWYRIVDVASNGNVGINQTSPQQKLDVYGNISLGSWVKPGSTYVGLRRNDDGSFGGGGDSGLVIESYNHAAPYTGDYSQRVHLRTHLYNGGSHNVLTAYGTNVGIGTATPNKQLTFAQANDDAIQIRRLTTSQGNTSLGTGISWTWTSAGTDNETWAAIRVIMPGNGNTNMTFSTTPVGGGGSGLSERMRITDAGNVGIGTTSPNAKLNVRGTDGSGSVSPQEDLVHVGGNELGGIGGYAGIRIGGASNTSYGAYIRGVKTTAYGNYWNTALTFSVTRTNTETTIDEVMRITSGGNVGIGTTSPSFKTTISADITKSGDINPGTAQLSLEGATTPGKRMILGYDINSNGFGFIKAGYFGVTWTPLSLQPDGGNVGIGETSPSQKLHVSGNIRVTGAYYDSANGAGTSGQILSSTGTGTAWIAAPSGGGVSGSGTTNYVTKWTSGSAVGNSSIYDNGNVGIGTTSPSSPFTVAKDVRAASLTATDLRPQSQLNLLGGGGDSLFIGQLTNSTVYMQSSYFNATLATYPIAINPLGGNVGIGTTAPVVKTHIVGPTLTTTSETTYPLWLSDTGDTTKALILGFDLANDVGVIQAVDQATSWKNISISPSGGNVGIGVQMPQAKLDISGGYIRLQELSNNANGWSVWSGAGYLSSRITTSGHSRSWGWEFTDNYPDSATANVFFRVGYNGAVSYLNSGNFGIGTTSPIGPLEVYRSATGALGGHIIVNNNGTAVGNETALMFGDGGINAIRAAISSTTEGAPYAGDIKFKTGVSAYASLSTQMIIKGNGNVGIGTTAPLQKLHVVGAVVGGNTGSTGLPNPSGVTTQLAFEARSTAGGNDPSIAYHKESVYTMYLQGQNSPRGLRLYSPTGETTANFYVQGDVVAFSSSDRRLKDNLSPIPSALEKVSKLTGYEFDWNENQSAYTGHDYGVVAQEVEAVLPELVQTREDGYKAVKYDKIVAVLIEAMKEQQKQIDELKSKLK